MAAALICALPGAALAATVEVNEVAGDLVYKAGPGERNQVHIEAEGGGPDPWHVFVTATVTDTASIATGTGCSRPDPEDGHVVRCGFRLGDSQAIIRLGNLDDAASFSSNVGMGAVFTGGAGDDVMSGGDGEDVFEEGRGRNGSDTMLGGSSPDAVLPIRDVVRYRQRRHPIRADLAGDRDDGERGERDRIGADVESLTGGQADDRISGNHSSNKLAGGPGTDTVAGLGGPDVIDAGGIAPDRGGTRDRLSGGGGSDMIRGSSGGNVISGGSGADVIHAFSGRDRIEAADGAVDRVHCYDGKDSAHNDPFDFVLNCERRDPYSAAAAVPLQLRVWSPTSVQVVVACREHHPAACDGTAQLEVNGRPAGPEAKFIGMSRETRLLNLELDAPLPAGAELAVRLRARSAANSPTSDVFPASSLLGDPPPL